MWRFSLVVSLFLTIALTQKSSGPILFSNSIKQHSLSSITYYKKEGSRVFLALMTGERRYLSRKFKKKIKTLGLVHLFTPSGLHFSSILLFLLPLSLYSKKSYKLISIGLCFMPFFFPGFFSMKRIALLRLFFIFKNKSKILKDLDSFYLFLIVFVLDFIFGTYSQSPLSFALSFLFIGAIFSSEQYSSFQITSKFIFSQVLICLFFNAPWNPVGSIIGLIITFFFSFIFPFFLFDYSINSLFKTTFFSKLMDSFIYIIDLTSDFAFNFDFIWPNTLLLIALYLSLFRSNISFFSLPLFLLFSNPAQNLPNSGLKGLQPYARTAPKDNSNVIKTTLIPRGYKTHLDTGYFCYHHLKRWGYTSKCQRKKLPKGYWEAIKKQDLD